MSYDEAQAWLFGLQGLGVKLGLENVHALLDALGRPERRCPHVLVAGTNGKGSVVSLMAAALAAQGLKVGAYTSPHLVRFEERIRIDGACLAAAEVARLTDQIKSCIEALSASGTLTRHPTFFEVTTALAWAAFAEAGVEVVVDEVGLGGRYDATNASDPCLSVVTTIALEHTRWLGPTVEDIARQKAGVMRPNRTCVTGAEDPRVLAVLRVEATSLGAHLVVSHQRARARVVAMDRAGSELDVETERTHYANLHLGLRGRHQVSNATTALIALEELPAPLRPSPAAIAAGFAGATWPGRLEEWPGTPRLLLDGAHNPHAARALSAYLAEFEPGPKTLIFASLDDKDVKGMAETLFGLFDTVVLTAVKNHRALDPAAIAPLVPPGLSFTLSPDTRSALVDARRASDPRSGLVVVAGSLYLVGEAKAVLAGAGPPEPNG